MEGYSLNFKVLIKRLLNKFKLKNLVKSILILVSKKYVLLTWYKHPSKNFGDDLNPWLFQKLTRKKVIYADDVINIGRKTVYSFIGSILESKNQKYLHVIGSGFISSEGQIKYFPKNVSFVRGPLTRERLISLGVKSPDVYCDPALLLPLVYKNKKNKKYQLGVIPHYVDKENSTLNYFKEQNEILIIDIQDDIEKVINDILSCEKIISSSLHGIIVSDAFNIPAKWVEFSDKVIGNGFKFHDYYLSVGRNLVDAFIIKSSTTIDDVYRLFEQNDKIDFNIDSILKVFPMEIYDNNQV